MVLKEQVMTIEEFWAYAEQDESDRLYELVDGVIVDMAPPNRLNSWIVMEIGYHLKAYSKKHNSGHVFGSDGGFALDEKNMRIPDVSYISKARMADKMTDMKAIIAPDLAVEIISPSESAPAVHRKTALYLKSGASMVWNVYPQAKIIEVWTQSDTAALQMRSYAVTDTLDGGDTLPGFELTVKEVFPADDTEQD